MSSDGMTAAAKTDQPTVRPPARGELVACDRGVVLVAGMIVSDVGQDCWRFSGHLFPVSASGPQHVEGLLFRSRVQAEAASGFSSSRAYCWRESGMDEEELRRALDDVQAAIWRVRGALGID
jgi:hypothetical protein